jgi:hypothetical protein
MIPSKLDLSQKIQFSALLFCLFALLCYGKFNPFFYPTAMGDDLANFLAFNHGDFASSFHQALGGIYAARYRPGFQLVWWGLQSTFGPNMKVFEYVNIGLTAASAVVFFWMTMSLSRSLVVSFGLAAAFVLSRFQLFQVISATGLLESLALIFFMASLLCVLQCRITKWSAPYSWGAVIASALAVYTHERYFLVPIVYAMALFFFGSAEAKTGSRDRLALAFLAIPISNVLIKKLAFHSDFFVGTGSAQGFHFSFEHLVQQLGFSISSIFGFNQGWPWFFGEKYSVLPKGYLILAALLPVAFVISLASLLRDKEREKARIFVLFLLLGGALLLPAVATFPMQPRWLVAPLALVLLWLALVLSSRAMVPLAISLLIVGFGYTRTFDPIVWVNYAKAVDGIRNAYDRGDLPKEGPIIFAVDEDLCQWPMAKGGLFELYGHGKRDVSCVNTLDNAKRLHLNAPVFYPTAAGYRSTRSGD